MNYLASIIAIAMFFNVQANECEQVRVAFDVGSGTTKMKVAKVDTCLKKIITVLKEENRPVGYKQSLGEDKRIDATTVAKGIKALKDLKKIAMKFKPTQFKAVATSAFRKAKNSKEVIDAITKATKIELKVIDQDEEAKLGYLGGSAKAKSPLQNVLVWDIGGGSMQMITMVNKKIQVYGGTTASVSFKDIVIKEVQKKNPEVVTSPNPITSNEGKKAQATAYEIARNDLSEVFKAKLRDPKTEILGIGGVHYYSVKNQIGAKEVYTYKQLQETLKKRLGLSDDQIEGKYKSTEVSNLLLVSGFMEALNIKKVYPVKVNLADGLLLQ